MMSGLESSSSIHMKLCGQYVDNTSFTERETKPQKKPLPAQGYETHMTELGSKHNSTSLFVYRKHPCDLHVD